MKRFFKIKPETTLMLYFGCHITAKGELLRIKNMSEEHLENCIKYGENSVRRSYWEKAVPMFKKELKSRPAKVKANRRFKKIHG